MAYNKYDKLEWTLIFATEFGKRFGLSLKQAFNYLSRYQGIAFVDSHYDYVHTQSFASMVPDMSSPSFKQSCRQAKLDKFTSPLRDVKPRAM